MSPGRVADRDRVPKNRKRLRNLPISLASCQVLPPSSVALVNPPVKSADAPAADPAPALVDEADALQVGVALRVVDRQPRPGRAAVGGLQDGAVREVLQRDEADVAVEELDLPAPFAERKLRLLPGEPVGPGVAAVRRSRARPA